MKEEFKWGGGGGWQRQSQGAEGARYSLGLGVSPASTLSSRSLQEGRAVLVESLPGTGQEGLCSLSLAAALGVELGFQEPVDQEGAGKARPLQARGAPGAGQGQGLWQPSFSRWGCCHLGFPMGFPVRSCWLRAGGGQEAALQVEVRA